MTDAECVAFLQWALPRLDLRWPGFRKVRRQVCKRVTRRLTALGLPGITAYRDYLAAHEDEWPVLDGLCRITISRFYRDRAVFEHLARDVFPALAASRRTGPVTFWSAGCASGEEPYSLAILWHFASEREPGWPTLSIVATDVDAHLLERAATACYPGGAFRDAPAAWREAAFEQRGDQLCLRAAFRRPVKFVRQDIRTAMPTGPFDLILCRNLAFTYFAPAVQARVLVGIEDRLADDGWLVIGRRETLPEGAGFAPSSECPEILRKSLRKSTRPGRRPAQGALR
jgi:chemotaxis protein methyltransferase CheR